MDKFMSLSQLVMAILMLVMTIVWGIAHLIKGTIGFFGCLMVLFFAYLIWQMCKVAWVEYQQEKNK